MVALTLANICLDVQISICMYLHPSDILALRKTCRAFQHSTRQRAVWVAALHQICIDNTLFLPSFPISEMSDSEIEKAAMGPRRWIELCAAFERQHLNDHGAILCPRTTRTIDGLFAYEIDYFRNKIFIVPGGRYVVCSSRDSISVLDLGYTSCADFKLIASASVGIESRYKYFKVRATTDGMGLIILTYNIFANFSVYEIYPQSETPYLTQIAHLKFDSTMEFHELSLLSGKVIWNVIYDDRIVFRVWNYRLPMNHSISFSVQVVVNIFENRIQVIMTDTAVIVTCQEAILIWAIPPLSPQLDSSLFERNPTFMPPPLFKIPFPDGIAVSECIRWMTISSWYFGSSHSLYFDMICEPFKHRSRFQIMLEPNLSTASLNIINTHEPIPLEIHCTTYQDYRICEDTLVICWIDEDSRCGVHTGLTSPRFGNVLSPGGPAARMLLPDIGHEYILFSCPASGRFVRLDETNSVAILDFF